MKTKIILILTLVACMTAHAIETIPLRNGKKTMPAISLFAGYEENEVAMDAAVKGKRIYLFGTVETVGKDVRGRAYVLLSAGEAVGGVQCFFRDNSLQLLAAMRKGQRVFLSGTVLGKIGNVLLDECLVEDPL